jgi:hypothetical protein
MGVWVPIVPESISSLYTDQLIPMVDELGIWKIHDPVNGNVIYQWNSGALMWESGQTTSN